MTRTALLKKKMKAFEKNGKKMEKDFKKFEQQELEVESFVRNLQFWREEYGIDSRGFWNEFPISRERIGVPSRLQNDTLRHFQSPFDRQNKQAAAVYEMEENERDAVIHDINETR